VQPSAKFLRELLKSLAAGTGNADCCAPRMQCAGDSAADAAGRSCHQGGLAAQIEHPALPQSTASRPFGNTRSKIIAPPEAAITGLFCRPEGNLAVGTFLCIFL